MGRKILDITFDPHSHAARLIDQAAWFSLGVEGLGDEVPKGKCLHVVVEEVDGPKPIAVREVRCPRCGKLLEKDAKIPEGKRARVACSCGYRGTIRPLMD